MATNNAGAAALPRAERALRKQEMTRFGQDLAWLKDPSTIPEDVVNPLEEAAGSNEPYANLANWMTAQVVSWSEARHSRLDMGQVFDRYGLTETDRDRVREIIRTQTLGSYAPGIQAMAEIHDAVANVASREGIDPALWGSIALQARNFGALLARHPTYVQGIVRTYLYNMHQEDKVMPQLDPAKLKLDPQTGITTVTPIEGMLDDAAEVVDELIHVVDPSAVCAGLQSVPEGFDGRTMFDLVWRAFSFASARSIYPTQHSRGREA